jgi:hypothetical protein
MARFTAILIPATPKIQMAARMAAPRPFDETVYEWQLNCLGGDP